MAWPPYLETPETTFPIVPQSTSSRVLNPDDGVRLSSDDHLRGAQQSEHHQCAPAPPRASTEPRQTDVAHRPKRPSHSAPHLLLPNPAPPSHPQPPSSERPRRPSRSAPHRQPLSPTAQPDKKPHPCRRPSSPTARRPSHPRLFGFPLPDRCRARPQAAQGTSGRTPQGPCAPLSAALPKPARGSSGRGTG